jgi:hypothetical protein
MEVLHRFFRFPPKSAFVFGPRGTGKSTWLRHPLPDAVDGDLGFTAIEVQNSTAVRSGDLRPLRSFVADYPEAQPLLPS